MGNVSRAADILRKNQKEMLGIKYAVAEVKDALMGLLVDCIWLRKESLSMRKEYLNTNL